MVRIKVEPPGRTETVATATPAPSQMTTLVSGFWGLLRTCNWIVSTNYKILSFFIERPIAKLSKIDSLAPARSTKRSHFPSLGRC